MILSDYSKMWILAGIAGLALLGCSKREVIETEYVEGVVTLDGQPVPDAVVTFVPVDRQQGISATGRTDQEGRYKITAVGLKGGATAKAGGGTLAGEYFVGVVKDETPSVSDEQIEEGSSSGLPRAPEVKHIVPAKYNNPRTSGIKVTVKKGKNNIPIELTSR